MTLVYALAGRGHGVLLSEPVELLLPGRRGPPHLSDTRLGSPHHDDRNRVPGGASSGREFREASDRVAISWHTRERRASGFAASRVERPRVLLTFATLSWQKGSAAQVVSLVGEMRKLRRTFASFSCRTVPTWTAARRGLSGSTSWIRPSPGERVEIGAASRCSAGVCDARVRTWRRVALATVSSDHSVARAYAEADLVIDLSGDSYRDPPGGFAFAHHATFLAALATRTPYALVSQSLGPFRG